MQKHKVNFRLLFGSSSLEFKTRYENGEIIFSCLKKDYDFDGNLLSESLKDTARCYFEGKKISREEAAMFGVI